MVIKIIGCLGGILTALVASAVEFEQITPEQAGFSGEKLSAIERRFDALYESGRIPNYAIGLYSGKKRFYSKSKGTIEIDGGANVGLDTIYPLASMTKPIESTAIMRLIQDGKLSLDSKLGDFYPEFRNMFVAPGGSFEATFQEAKREITIKDLLTHTSGFTYHTFVTGQGDVAKQYDDLQIVWDKYKKNELIVLGAPSNSFNQEKKSNNEVKEFCEFNFNITFPITEISEVKGETAISIYKWALENYGPAAKPKWNFHKILINREGKIADTYSSLTNPRSKKITSRIEELIQE